MVKKSDHINNYFIDSLRKICDSKTINLSRDTVRLGTQGQTLFTYSYLWTHGRVRKTWSSKYIFSQDIQRTVKRSLYADVNHSSCKSPFAVGSWINDHSIIHIFIQLNMALPYTKTPVLPSRHSHFQGEGRIRGGGQNRT